MMDAILRSQFPPTFRLIHLFEGGSAQHGARISDKNDLDIFGVFFEDVEKALGLDCYEHFVTSTSDNSRRNNADDVDITLYSLRRWAQLAAKGNPTALNFLFAKNDFYLNNNPWNRYVDRLREALVAKSAAGHYRGFVDGQMKRLMGEGQGKHGQRPELEAEFGYDTKAGMHAVRLMGEGIELMQTGKVTFPRPNTRELISIRKGEMPLGYLQEKVRYLMQDLEQAYEASTLPAKPDRQRVSDLISQMYLQQYSQ
jgi:predicted nucleotidyltransferase